jgi:hypothetical protein
MFIKFARLRNSVGSKPVLLYSVTFDYLDLGFVRSFLSYFKYIICHLIRRGLMAQCIGVWSLFNEFDSHVTGSNPVVKILFSIFLTIFFTFSYIFAVQTPLISLSTSFLSYFKCMICHLAPMGLMAQWIGVRSSFYEFHSHVTSSKSRHRKYIFAFF